MNIFMSRLNIKRDSYAFQDMLRKTNFEVQICLMEENLIFFMMSYEFFEPIMDYRNSGHIFWIGMSNFLLKFGTTSNTGYLKNTYNFF